MALVSNKSEDFGAGIHRGRKAPSNAVYDAVNCLIDDTANLFKRGGSAYHSTSDAAGTLSRLAAFYYPGLAAPRVTAWDGTNLVAFNGATPVAIEAISQPSRPASVGGIAAFPVSSAGRIVYYAGSLKTADYSNGTVSTVAGSRIVTGNGTAWSANVDAGMLLRHSGSGRTLVVRSVDNNQQVTLTTPWPTTNVESVLFTFFPAIDSSVVLSFDFPTLGSTTYVAAAGSGSPRLIVILGNRAYLSDRGDPFTFDTDTYHDFPSNAEMTGAQGVGDSVMVFGSTGVYAVSGLSFDAIDASGNQQHVVQQISGEIILWGERGITPWQGGVLVPAVDDIHALGPDGSSVSITGDPENEKVRRLWRSYTKTAGYAPGDAAIHRGHLFMPILQGTTVIDVLVCRLDRGSAFTRWSGHAASSGFAVMPGSTSAAAKLLGVSGLRVTDLSATLDPVAGNSADADSTVPSMTVITRDIGLSSNNQHGFCHRIRVRAEVTDDANGATAAAAATAEYSSDADGGTFTALTEKGEQEGGTGWATSTGSKYWWALVGKRRERIRFRLVFSGGTASTILREITLLLRPSGRQ